MRISMIVVALAAVLVLSVSVDAQEARPLTNQDVIDMVKGGLAESLILTSVQSAPEEFSTNPQDLMQLQNAGVPVSIVQAMIARNSSAAPPPGGVVLPEGYPAMPGPPVVVAIDGERRVELSYSTKAFTRQKVNFLRTKSQQIIVLPGGSSTNRLASRTPSFEVPAVAGMDPRSLISLVRMTVKGDTREAAIALAWRDTSLSKTIPDADDVIASNLEPMPGGSSFMRTYLLTPMEPLQPGEYGVVTSGAQLWDFGVD